MYQLDSAVHLLATVEAQLQVGWTQALENQRLGLLGEIDFLHDYCRGKECGKYENGLLVPGCHEGCPHDYECEICGAWGARCQDYIIGEGPDWRDWSQEFVEACRTCEPWAKDYAEYLHYQKCVTSDRYEEIVSRKFGNLYN